ncbi:GAF domain-containing protein [Nocardia blacklockiae]|uniref:GAF domain-containing protein n=1 Tax=Nocardia blacklockiae TaxID=480036 RepID=UPI0018947C08|nr:GAF domain-containing protein [Nocardia blacklockiae]MBF6170346.1 GAF domain-containing protein [Nocardia blacklockiae]
MHTPAQHGHSALGRTADCARLASAIAAALPGRPAVGIAAVGGGGLHTAAASSPRARLLEETQLIHLGGPGRDAAAGGRPVLVADMVLETQWDADFRRDIRILDVRSLYCRPVTGGTGTLGVLTLYGTRPNAFAPTVDHLLRPFQSPLTDALRRLRSRSR